MAGVRLRADRQRVIRVFEQWDLNDDGFMEQDEFQRVLLGCGMDEGATRRMFEAADLNRDGRLSYLEFVDWLFDAAPPTGADADADADDLGYVTSTLEQVRARQGEIERELYSILDEGVPEGNASEALRAGGNARRAEYEDVLIRAASAFQKDVAEFRASYEVEVQTLERVRRPGEAAESDGTEAAIPAREAVDRLKRLKEMFDTRRRKQQVYLLGEELLGLPQQEYPALEQTQQDIKYLGMLYDLCMDVNQAVEAWKDYFWADVPAHLETMRKQIESFAIRCKTMPKKLRGLAAYHEVRAEIEDFQGLLFVVEGLQQPSIMPRHWEEVRTIAAAELPVESKLSRFRDLAEAGLHNHVDAIYDVIEKADKEFLAEVRRAKGVET